MELAGSFDLVRLLNHGTLPAIYDESDYFALLQAYCSDYLEEEISDEGLVRKLAPFSQFLEFAALDDTLSYWKVHQGPEVDFVVGLMKAGIEAKAVASVHSEHLNSEDSS